MDEQLLHKISQYLDGKMNPQELELFQNELKVNSDLKDELEVERDIRALVKFDGRQNLRAQLDDISNDIESGKDDARNKLKVPMSWLVAASVVVLAAVFIWSYFQPAASGQELYAQYFVPYPDVLTARDQNMAEGMQSGLASYNSENYEDAINWFVIICNSHPEHTDSRFYLGLSYLASGEAQSSIEHLDLVILEDDMFYSQAARWYAALAYLNLEKLPEAKKILIGIWEGANGDFRAEAKLILRELN